PGRTGVGPAPVGSSTRRPSPCGPGVGVRPAPGPSASARTSWARPSPLTNRCDRSCQGDDFTRKSMRDALLVGIVAFWGLEAVYEVDSLGRATVTTPATELQVS